MKKFLFVICFMMGMAATAYPQIISGRISSSLYSFERIDTVSVQNTYLRAFEMMNLNITKNNFSLRTYFNYEGDLSKELNNDPRLRLYNLYLEARDLFDVMTLKLGRQPLFNSVAGGVYDGLSVKLKKSNYKLDAYYGGNVPAYQEFKTTSDWKNDFIAGGKFSTTALKNFQISLSYVNKNFKQEKYWATRLGPNLDPIKVLIENNSNQYQYASAYVDYDMKNVFSVNTRYDYDINFEQTSKFEFNGVYKNIDKLKLDVYYNYRAPRIRYNSIFSVFDYGNTQEVEVGGDYEINKELSATARYGNVIYKDDNSQRVTVGINTQLGSVTYRKTFGYAGELDAVSLYAAHSFFDGFVTPSLGLSYTNYKLSEESPKNNLTTLLAGVNIRPVTQLSVDLQGQYMNNKIYKNDFRFFLKLNYWFHTNLNLM